MEFNQLIRNQLLPILQRYGYEIHEEFKNVIRFASSKVEINIVFNDYDKSLLCEIGEKSSFLYPLNNHVVKSIFHSDLEIDQLTPKVFVNNLTTLFEQNAGIEILNGQILPLISLAQKHNKAYTENHIHNHYLNLASDAWISKDYQAFIKILDSISYEKMPELFKLKYQYAKQKMGQK